MLPLESTLVTNVSWKAFSFVCSAFFVGKSVDVVLPTRIVFPCGSFVIAVTLSARFPCSVRIDCRVWDCSANGARRSAGKTNLIAVPDHMQPLRSIKSLIEKTMHPHTFPQRTNYAGASKIRRPDLPPPNRQIPL